MIRVDPVPFSSLVAFLHWHLSHCKRRRANKEEGRACLCDHNLIQKATPTRCIRPISNPLGEALGGASCFLFFFFSRAPNLVQTGYAMLYSTLPYPTSLLSCSLLYNHYTSTLPLHDPTSLYLFSSLPFYSLLFCSLVFFSPPSIYYLSPTLHLTRRECASSSASARDSIDK